MSNQQNSSPKSRPANEIMSRSRHILQKTVTAELAVKENKSRRNGHDLELTQKVVTKAATEQDVMLSILREAYQKPDSYFSCEKTRLLFVRAVDCLLCQSCKDALLHKQAGDDTTVKQCFAKHLGLQFVPTNCPDQSCTNEADERQ